MTAPRSSAQGASPVPMAHHDHMSLRTAAYHAKKVYPGPVGELIARELLAFDDLGYIGDRGNLVHRLAAHVMTEQPRTST